MNCAIDTSNAGSYAAALDEAAARFCESHPSERWTISSVLHQNEKRHLKEKIRKHHMNPAGVRVCNVPIVGDERNNTRNAA
jgi:hypothetical protein